MTPIRAVLGIILLMELGLVAGAGFAYRAAAEDVARSVATTGEVIGARSNRDRDGNTTYAPILRFTTEDGQSVESSPTLATSFRPTIGERWEIRYDRENPSRVWADTFLGTWFLPLILGGIGGFGVLVTATVAFFVLRRGM